MNARMMVERQGYGDDVWYTLAIRQGRKFYRGEELTSFLEISLRKLNKIVRECGGEVTRSRVSSVYTGLAIVEYEYDFPTRYRAEKAKAALVPYLLAMRLGAC